MKYCVVFFLVLAFSCMAKNKMEADLLIKIDKSIPAERIKAIMDENNLQVIETIPSLDIVRAKSTRGEDLKTLINRLKSYKEIIYAEPNSKVGVFKNDSNGR